MWAHEAQVLSPNRIQYDNFSKSSRTPKSRKWDTSRRENKSININSTGGNRERFNHLPWGRRFRVFLAGLRLLMSPSPAPMWTFARHEEQRNQNQATFSLSLLLSRVRWQLSQPPSNSIPTVLRLREISGTVEHSKLPPSPVVHQRHESRRARTKDVRRHRWLSEPGRWTNVLVLPLKCTLLWQR